ncbi:ROK family glucokinase [Mobilicoccus caccae]|uniref:Glucokinase n=1 Tax=Mobilicoccus caccae TaxID=1859295 RepID=A0ABQ6IPH0_9MICO|nr:ROK family glucokinase [Mobilicoccus caccae]GMA39815.1 glucokinase [Mobilicoccus caccae]
MTTVGLDIGGTKILGAVVEEDGTILARGKRDTAAEDPTAIVAAAADLVDELAGDGDVEAVGVAVAGFLDRERERVVFAPNVSWRGESLRADLAALVRLPVVIENDANAATWGEFVHGSAKDVDDLLFLTIGTGVGGGVVTDGQLLRGAFGMGAELGHMRVVPNGRLCGCGIHGCLEQYASGTALVRSAQHLVASGAPEAAVLANRCGGDARTLTGRDVTDAAMQGDPAAVGLLAELGRWLGEGVASLAAILDPEVVLIGGGVSQAGALLLDPAREAFTEHLTGRGFRPQARLLLAELLDDAGVVGAAALARDLVRTGR